MALLQESDLTWLLGNPAVVADWCHRQLQRPPAERPARLTAELNTPWGRAELLLQPELLLQVFAEAVPDRSLEWEEIDEDNARHWSANFQPMKTYQECRRFIARRLELMTVDKERADEALSSVLPELGGQRVAQFWRQRLRQILTGDELQVWRDLATGQWKDNWKLRSLLLQSRPKHR